MNKRASALILGLFVILVLAGLSASFLYKQVNQSFISNRYADSTRALWVAESGLRVVNNDALCNGCTTSPVNVGQGYFVRTMSITGSPVTEIINSTLTNTTTYYQVNTRGTVGGVSRTIDAVLNAKVSITKVPAGNFAYGLESSVDIDFKGSSKVYGETTPIPVPAKYRDTDYYKQNSTFSFVNLFSYSPTELKAMSTVYNNTWPSGTISGLNWVVAPSSHFNGTVTGTGILIIQGNLRVTGTINFDGIIYVIGELDMAGTANVRGSVLAESAASVDTTVTGTADIEHNSAIITNALDLIKKTTPFPPRVVSWKEIQ